MSNFDINKAILNELGLDISGRPLDMSNVIEIEIPIQCLEDEAYTDCPDFNIETDGCESCEFIREAPVGCIGGQIGIMGYARSCEKGYWKDDV